MKPKTQELLAQMRENHDFVECIESNDPNLAHPILSTQCRLCGMSIHYRESVEGEALTKFFRFRQPVSLLDAVNCPPTISHEPS